MRFAAACKARGVAFLVAPYEADAQMAYLALTGAVAGVVTEDSDLIPYGCPAVFFKMDRGGSGVLLRAADFPAARKLPLAGFDTAMLQETCALAGCDFVKGLPGIGVVTAANHMKKHRSGARTLRALRLGGRVAVPPGYEAAWARAVWTFRHQRVFCPSARTMVHVSPLPAGGLALPDGTPLVGGEGGEEGGEDPLAFLGPVLPPALAAAIAAGEVDPMTHEPFSEEEEEGLVAGRGRAAQQRPHHNSGGRFSFHPLPPAAAGRTGGAPHHQRPPRPLPVAANGVAALFARHNSTGSGGDGAGRGGRSDPAAAAFVPPRRATGEGPAAAVANPPSHRGRTPAERAAIHGPGGWGSQPPDGWGRGAAGAADARPLALSGPAAPTMATATTTGSAWSDEGGHGHCAAAVVDRHLATAPSPTALEHALAAERAPFAACFAWGSGQAGEVEGEGEELEPGEASQTPPRPAAAAPPPAVEGPRWRATPAGWRDFYATSPAADENAPADGGKEERGGGRRSAHFPPAGGSPRLPKKRAALFCGAEEEEEGALPPPKAPFGGLGHVAGVAAAAAAAVGRPGGGKKKKGGGGAAAAATTTATPATRPPFAAFAFGVTQNTSQQ